MLRNKIEADIKSAMRAKDSVKLDSLRYVWSKIKELEIDKKSELSEEEVLAVIAKEVKSRKEAIEQFEGAGRKDLVSDEKDKLVFLEELLPEQMSEVEIEKVVDEIISEGASDFGVVMGQAMGKLKGKAEGSLVSKIVKQKIS